MLRQDSTKRYNQLAVDLLKKILNRHYLPGSKLPSTRELAKQAGVNPNTMQRALQVLQDEKILIKQSTTGRYVTTDIQHLKNIRNRMLEQIKQNYQEEIRSYGNEFENDGTIGGKAKNIFETVITRKSPFISLTKLYARFCRYIRYTHIRQVMKCSQ